MRPMFLKGDPVNLIQYDYDSYARYYDVLEQKPEYVRSVNEMIHGILNEYSARTVHDFTCGTGAQVFYLHDLGYEVSGSDINESMLIIARKKRKGRKISLRSGNICNSRFGRFDAAISIFNAVGHINRRDLGTAMENVAQNLKDGGIFIFDILNLDYMTSGNFVRHEFMDVARTEDNTKYVRFNHNTLDEKEGIMHVDQRIYIQKRLEKMEVMEHSYDLQIYTAEELKKMLKNSGYRSVKFLSHGGNRFEKRSSLNIFATAVK
jgi:SAM-dependent methyltransferase